MENITNITANLSECLTKHYYTFNSCILGNDEYTFSYTFNITTGIPNVIATITINNNEKLIPSDQKEIDIYAQVSNNGKILYKNNLVGKDINEDSIWDFIEEFQNNLHVMINHMQEVELLLKNIKRYCNANGLDYKDYINVK